MRYLVVAQVLGASDGSPFASPEALGNNTIGVGPWSIVAELDPSRPAALEIRSSDQKAVLGVNKPSVAIGSKRYKTTRPDSSILVEKLRDRDTVAESADSGPRQ